MRFLGTSESTYVEVMAVIGVVAVLYGGLSLAVKISKRKSQ